MCVGDYRDVPGAGAGDDPLLLHDPGKALLQDPARLDYILYTELGTRQHLPRPRDQVFRPKQLLHNFYIHLDTEAFTFVVFFLVSEAL